MLLLLLVFCLSVCRADNITGYDPSELLSKIFNANDTQPRAGYGLAHLDQYGPDHSLGVPGLREQGGQYGPDPYPGFGVQGGQYGPDSYPGFGDQGSQYGPDPYPGFGDQGGQYGPETSQGLGDQGPVKKRRRRPKKIYQQYVGGYINNGDNFYNRPIRRPSLASTALSSVTDALSSVARYDDYQCVPRLLCEASGGMGTRVLPSVPGLESLLTLLSAYSGITTNPLFVFGRAVYLGVSSYGNPAACRYAYPLCPTDAEKLVHYLNNHNGGFFRFFNSPQQQQNLDQFYDQLSQNHQNPYDQSQVNPGQYGFYRPNLYGNQQQYGSAYNYNQGFQTNKIQKRIQNRPHSNAIEEDAKWKFPEGNGDFEDDTEDVGVVDNFKFPESNKNDRKTRGFAFPTFVTIPSYKEPTNDKFVFTNQNYNKVKYQDYNRYVKEDYYNKEVLNNYNHYNRVPVNNNYYNDNKDNLQTVYVVRGNGDPNRPEIIKLKPGQSIKDF